jgi:AcrR family transcriptional regulator
MITSRQHPMTTRQRIVTAAVELFARQGYARTTVGQIEAAAGLTPRAGGFYKHFASKAAVLEVALAQRTEATDAVVVGLEDTAARGGAAELRLLGRVAMHELDAERDLLRIVMKDGEQFPELRREYFERFPRRGYGLAEEWLRGALADRGADVPDVESFAAVVMGGLVHFFLMETVFGEPPPGTDRERFLDAWVQSTLALLSELHAMTPKEATA